MQFRVQNHIIEFSVACVFLYVLSICSDLFVFNVCSNNVRLFVYSVLFSNRLRTLLLLFLSLFPEIPDLKVLEKWRFCAYIATFRSKIISIGQMEDRRARKWSKLTETEASKIDTRQIKGDKFQCRTSAEHELQNKLFTKRFVILNKFTKR